MLECPIRISELAWLGSDEFHVCATLRPMASGIGHAPVQCAHEHRRVASWYDTNEADVDRLGPI